MNISCRAKKNKSKIRVVIHNHRMVINPLSRLIFKYIGKVIERNKIYHTISMPNRLR